MLKQFITLIRDMESAQQIRVFRLAALGLLFFAVIPVFLSFEPKVPSVKAPWTRSKGEVRNEHGLLKENGAFTSFQVCYKPSGDRLSCARVYAATDAYRKAGLKKNSVVWLDLEKQAEGVIVRRLFTAEGNLLYDPSVQADVSDMINTRLRGEINFILCEVILIFAAAEVRRFLASKKKIS